MKIVRGRAEARWLPSRHHFALFRLASYLELRRARPEPRPVILVIDHHQSVIETYSVSLWIFASVVLSLAPTLFGRWPLPAALAVAIPAAMILIELPVHGAGVVLTAWNALSGRRDLDNTRAQSFALMTILLGAAGWLTTRASWARYVGWQFLAIAGLNAAAAVIVFLLRDSIARLETAVGGPPSEL